MFADCDRRLIRLALGAQPDRPRLARIRRPRMADKCTHRNLFICYAAGIVAFRKHVAYLTSCTYD